ncbi:MAG: enoyl-CoA hydratase-related protein [Syntrophomonas sp.]
MEEKPVLWSKDAGICTVVMNVPKTLNALSTPMLYGLEAAFEDCFDDSIRAVVLTGAGKAFCSGGDLAGAVAFGAQKWLFENPKKLSVVINTMRQLPKPVIASINGAAFGVGMSFALACDIRLASDKAVIAQAYTSVGLCPDGAWTYTVPQIVGMAKALELVMLDTPIKADEALRLGLVTKVVPAEQLEEETLRLARKLADGPTKAFASAKALINASMLPGLESQMEKERWGISGCGGSEDFKEGYEAVFSKRKAKFIGR